MASNGDNPCNVCSRSDDCPYDCVLNGLRSTGMYCTNYDCFLHYEDSCLIGIADRCGANPDFEFEEEDEE